MSRKIRVGLAALPYDVWVGEGILGECAGAIREACGGGRRCVVVTDSIVGPLYGGVLEEALMRDGVAVTMLTVPSGEASKSFGRLEEVCEGMAAARLDRKSFVVALGGGVVGDLAGFAAAIYLRGLPYAQIPTTVLAQVDSSVGGKTGINIAAGKNLVGAFHQPRLVVADTAVLASLPQRAFNEGMAECVKHGVIRDASLVREAPDLVKSNRVELIARNVIIKAAVVEADEFERSGERALLNFGHTVGHAIEQAAGYGTFLHGEAIAIGMAAALWLSQHKAGLAAQEATEVLAALAALDLPTRLPADLTEESLLAALARDKKFEEGHIRFVLTPALGSAFVSDAVTREDIVEALHAVRE